MTHRRDIAVCTRALSSGAYFKLWYEYYGRQVGHKNLFVISISKNPDEFKEFELGGIIDLSAYPYDERQKSRIFQGMMSILLQTHRYVIFPDVDEIIVADPAQYAGLLDFIEKNPQPYFTCIGFNVLQYKDDKLLDLAAPILLRQRSHARFASPLCKTCVTSVEFRVPNTFHYTEMYPMFSDLYLFHMKHADNDIEMQWGVDTRSVEFIDPTRRDHHNRTSDAVSKFKVIHDRRAVYNGEDCFPLPSTLPTILAGVRFDPSNRLYRWDRYDEPDLVRIPSRFQDAF